MQNKIKPQSIQVIIPKGQSFQITQNIESSNK